MRSVHSPRVALADSEPDADLPPERVKDAKRLRSDRGVVVVVGVVLRLADQVALRLNGGVTGSDDPDEADESIDGGMSG